MKIPFNKPCIVGAEAKYVTAAIEGGHSAGDGPFTHRCEQLLKAILPAKSVLLTTSCTHALEMSAILLDIKVGDEVIVPSFTFVSTINAYVLRGAKPVFVDIRSDTLNLDERLIRRAITPRTRAIIPVHYAGIACEMDAISSVAAEYNIPIVEDNAHGLFGKYKGKHLGTLGKMATLSFHETKNFICGEGGALIINDEGFVEQAEIIRDKGTNRKKFYRGQVDKYTWVNVGSSYVLSDLLAAMLLGQLEQREVVQAKRKQIWEYYYNHLSDWATKYGVRLPYVPDECDQAYHNFYLIMPSLDHRQGLIAHLKANSILSVFHYVPLHNSPMALSLCGETAHCPVTEDISARLLRLPFYFDLKVEELAMIVDCISKYRW